MNFMNDGFSKEFVETVTSGDSEPTAVIKSVQFGLLPAAFTHRSSHVEIANRQLYDQQRVPTSYGPLDRKLGISDKKSSCDTCGLPLQDCLGHFGHLPLEFPCFHIGFFKEVIRVLNCICKSCSRLVLDPKDYERMLKKAKARTRTAVKPQNRIRDQVLELCKKQKTCPHCEAITGLVRKVPGVFKIVHEIRDKKQKKQVEERRGDQLIAASKANKQLAEHIGKSLDELDTLRVRHLLKGITDDDAQLMGFDPELARPEDMLISVLPVPPVCIRPSVSMGASGTNEDDLTVKLGDIVSINGMIANAVKKGNQPYAILGNWEFLQTQVAMYINSDMTGFPKVPNTQPIRALTQRLKGKTGRFRGNLSGKRVDFSGRTVISPDPNLSVAEVGVPERVAVIMTFPERVTQYNVDSLRQCVINGPSNYPGANFVEFQNGTKVFLKYGKRDQIARQLRPGDIVERHLHNGDVVLFNRQPSLHRVSIMAHRARIHQGRTFRFNECVCGPYNADFDGDEMNLHVPQTLEARAEAMELMGVVNNLRTPRHGVPLIAATQDFLTACYLLTRKDTFFTRDKFTRLVSFIYNAEQHIEVPQPAIVKPVAMWTGKQVFSLLLEPLGPAAAIPTDRRSRKRLVDVELKGKAYSKHPNEVYPWMNPEDTYIVFRQSELMVGGLCKSALGSDKKGLVYAVLRNNGAPDAGELLNRLSKLSARWLGERGFSIGLDDVTPSDSLTFQKAQTLADGYTECDGNIGLYTEGKLPTAPGCTAQETLESQLLGRLSAIREDLGNNCFADLSSNFNAPIIMSACGSKGSNINISQMVACVGQQAVSGARIAYGFVNRTLPHFEEFCMSPKSRGFVENSFFTGLTATEFFFHTMGGREGLVDTAVKTAETGYMQRRLIKAMEDLCIQYDGTVRTAEQNVVQFTYGDDGLDPIHMADGPRPVQFSQMFQQARTVVTPEERSLVFPAVPVAPSTRASRRSARQQAPTPPPPASASLAQVDSRRTPEDEDDQLLGDDGLGDRAYARLLERLRDTNFFAQPDIGASSSSSSASSASPMADTPDAGPLAEPAMTPDHNDEDLMPLELDGDEDMAASSSAAFVPKQEPGAGKLPPKLLSAGDTGRRLSVRSQLLSVDELLQQLPGMDFLLPEQMVAIAETVCEMCRRRTGLPVSGRFLEDMFKFVQARAEDLRQELTKLGVGPADLLAVQAGLSGMGLGAAPEVVELAAKVVVQTVAVTEMQLRWFLQMCLRRFEQARAEPGTTVGAIGAQSIGEPGTQMTLKTFHFAGVASMNVTLGVPRIKEIINASKAISSPIITAPLDNPRDETAALHVKGLTERVLLSEVLLCMREAYTQEHAYLEIYLNMDTIRKRRLGIDAHSVRRRLLATRLKLKPEHLMVLGSNALRVTPQFPKENAFFSVQRLKSLLPELQIAGLPGVRRAVINSDSAGALSFVVEGNNLLGMMGTPGVQGSATTSNDTMEVASTLGIEAARRTVMEEIHHTMKEHGLSVDWRHVGLLADLMSFRGSILGITRFGISKMKDSVLMLASFEQTGDHLFEAALRSAEDPMAGVSENIIFGAPIPVGTGLFSLVYPAVPSAPQIKQQQPATPARTPVRGRAVAQKAAATGAIQVKQEPGTPSADAFASVDLAGGFWLPRVGEVCSSLPPHALMMRQERISKLSVQ